MAWALKQFPPEWRLQIREDLPEPVAENVRAIWKTFELSHTLTGISKRDSEDIARKQIKLLLKRWRASSRRDQRTIGSGRSSGRGSSSSSKPHG